MNFTLEILRCMPIENAEEIWSQFLEFVAERSSVSEYQNWFASIRFLEATPDGITLEVPNIYVQGYLVENYKKELLLFFPFKSPSDAHLRFVIATPHHEMPPSAQPATQPEKAELHDSKLNSFYTFENFIEGPNNQFVKSAALGVAERPGKSYNPLFIHGGVGLGKTHLLHAVGHRIKTLNKKTRVHCITTEEFINDLVDHLRNKTIDKMKRFYRSLDVLLVDDIQFLQNRLNFEEELCNTFESLLNQSRQIIITSDKPPSQLKLSERLVARMEWGLVANVGIPDLETRVAILQHKANLKGFTIPSNVAFTIGEHIFQNVRQLEGALNRLAAYCRLMNMPITEEVAKKILGDNFQTVKSKKLSIEEIIKSVAALYEVRVSDIKSSSRTKEIAFPRQVAMYLAKELLSDSLMKLSSAFGGKTHSTLLHAWKKISDQQTTDETLRRQLQMARRNLENS